jgi:hypothetical protein
LGLGNKGRGWAKASWALLLLLLLLLLLYLRLGIWWLLLRLLLGKLGF